MERSFEEVERLGLDTKEEYIFGVGVPKFVLPLSSGRNLSTLVETAVQNLSSESASGYDAAKTSDRKTYGGVT